MRHGVTTLPSGDFFHFLGVDAEWLDPERSAGVRLDWAKAKFNRLSMKIHPDKYLGGWRICTNKKGLRVAHDGGRRKNA